MSDEDQTPIELSGPGWQRLPDGRWQLPVYCRTIVDYIVLPKFLTYNGMTFHKTGFDTEKGLAYFRGDKPARPRQYRN